MLRRLIADQPRGLIVCFTTEMWERFSYYGMRALLVLFLTQYWRYSDQESYLIYGAYTALVYMLPVLGGLISDRYLGPRKAVVLGAVLLVLGHLGLTLEGPRVMEAMAGSPVIRRDAFYLGAFYLSLALITTGVGFLKSNISALVGTLYAPDDVRRDAGFTLFYMGINVGGAIAPLLCGWVGQVYGWRYGFGLASVGMLIGLIGFLRGQKYLLGHAEPPHPDVLRQRLFAGVTREVLVYAGATALVAVVWLLLSHPWLVGGMLAVFGTLAGAGILYFAFARCSRQERNGLLVCMTLIAFTIGFWAFYEQMGSSLNLFADRMVDRSVFGREIPASMFQALPAIFALLLAPMFASMWPWLGRRRLEPSTPVKFSLAIVQVGLAFLVLVMGTMLIGSNGKVALPWYMATFLLLVTGELCLVPVGMAMVSRLAPRRVAGMMMGTFFLAYGGSSFISGLIAQLTRVEAVNGQIGSPAAALATYAHVYSRLGIIALLVAGVLLVIAPILTAAVREPAAPGASHVHRLRESAEEPL